MNRLLEIGFEFAGHWLLEPSGLRLELHRHSMQSNILYAFICDGEVKYVGKTTQRLAVRMYGYRRPSESQTTNVRNNRLIIESLQKGEAVEILALPDNGLMHYGQFHMNLAAALEDSIIRIVAPPWNGGRVEKTEKNVALPANAQVVEALATGVIAVVVPVDPGGVVPVQTLPSEVEAPFEKSFNFTLQPTYWKTGFFNVAVASQHFMGADGDVVEILLPGAMQPILGAINRRCNRNGTPRIMGGSGLKNWFQQQGKIMGVINVQAFSPNSIRLAIAA